MAIRIRPADQIATEVSLSIAHLEELIAAAKENDLTFVLDPYHEQGYRYRIHGAGHTLLLKSNDIGDVARYLGLSQDYVEAGVVVDSAHPTQYVVDGISRGGAVPLQARESSGHNPTNSLPTYDDGTLDFSSRAFRIRRMALLLKSGFGALDCEKALRWKDGKADEALALLVSTNGFARTKV